MVQKAYSSYSMSGCDKCGVIFGLLFALLFTVGHLFHPVQGHLDRHLHGRADIVSSGLRTGRSEKQMRRVKKVFRKYSASKQKYGRDTSRINLRNNKSLLRSDRKMALKQTTKKLRNERKIERLATTRRTRVVYDDGIVKCRGQEKTMGISNAQSAELHAVAGV
jgi:hypothetical protein